MPRQNLSTRGKPLCTWVVVLGDYGRSPRMQYHSLSLSNKPNSSIEVLGYGGSAPLSSLTTAGNVRINTIPEPPACFRNLPRLLFLVFKVLHQLFWMTWMMLFKLPSPDNILLQNPPAIPTMFLCWLASKRHRAKLVIDWHNYGYSIMALSHGPSHWLVRIAKAYEQFWGKRGTAHFCVTAAMQQDLQHNWGVTATVLYDRPPSFFKKTDLQATHKLYTKLSTSLYNPQFKDYLGTPAQSGTQQPGTSTTIITEQLPGAAVASWRQERPAVVISSTSWTPDEDFGLLLDAAVLYDEAAQKDGTLPRLLLLITGKGPQKEMYLAKIQALQFKKVAIRTLWLESADYPLLLGAADIGVSLHASSSGLDLPMKVVDMFGSGLPVCALSYSCISELVVHGNTGMLFSSHSELAQQLAELLRGFPSQPSSLLQHLQTQVQQQQQALRWDKNWDNIAWPVLSGH